MQINQKLLTIVAKSQAAELQKQVKTEVEKSASEAGVSANSVDTTSIVNELLAANKDATVYSIADELAAGYAKGLTVSNSGKTETANPNASSLIRNNDGKTETANPNASSLVTSSTAGGKIEYADDIGEKIVSDLTIDSQYSVTFTDLKSLPDGESRMVMFIEDVAAKEIILPNKNKNVNTKLIVKTRLGIPIYVDKGRFVKTGSFNNLTVEKNNKNLVYHMQLSASGNSKVRYHGKAQIIKDKKLIQEFNMNSNTIRANGVFEETGLIPDNLEAGDYILKVILTYKNEKGENKNLIKEISFNVSNSI